MSTTAATDGCSPKQFVLGGSANMVAVDMSLQIMVVSLGLS